MKELYKNIKLHHGKEVKYDDYYKKLLSVNDIEKFYQSNFKEDYKTLMNLDFDILEKTNNFLIDDLVTKGTNEPYRMMTSRAEYRLLLRQDNADFRLTEIGHKIGLVTEERYEKFLNRKNAVENEIERLKNLQITNKKEVGVFLESLGSAELKKPTSLYELIKRSELDYFSLAPLDPEREELSEDIGEQVNIRAKYEGYIAKQLEQVNQFTKFEKKLLPNDIDYSDVKGLRTEAIQKLSNIRPVSIGQASRISGVSPADISVLLIYLEHHYNKR